MTLENDPKGVNRRRFLTMAAAAAGSLALVACGQAATDSGGTAAASGGAAAEGAPAASAAVAGGAATEAIVWSTWGNPGEIQRFQEFTADYNKRTGGKAELVPIPNDGYQAKVLTQLSGGTAPDTFYVGAEWIGQLITSSQVIDLTEQLNGPASKSPPGDFFEGLWGAAKTPDGKIYGMTVDCNPMVFWYNEQLLTDAGVTTMPADMQKNGEWTWDAHKDMAMKVVAAGKRGHIQENWFSALWGWPTTNGAKVWDGETYIGNTEAKTVEGFQHILDGITEGWMTYSGTLPKGQGQDAMFLSQQAAFINAGRWLLPVFKKAANLKYNIVSWPTNTGNKTEPAPVPTAYIAQNAAAKNPEGAFAFLTDFVSPEGQKFRLQGGGNAIPSIAGADDVVSEGNLPPNWQALIDAREVGYATWAQLASVSGLDTDINKQLDEVWLKGGDIQVTMDKIGALIKEKRGS